MLETPGTLREGAPDFARRADLSSQEPKVIATRVEAIAAGVPSLLGWRPSLLGCHRY